VWVFKGQEIYPETVRKIKDKGIFICNYNADHPFIIYSRGSGSSNVKKSIGLYNLHFSYSKEVVSKIEQEFKIKSEWLPFGYELDDEIYHESAEIEELNKVCFLGNPDKIRANLLFEIADSGIEIDVYGHNWVKWLNNHPNIQYFDAVYLDNMWKTLRKYRVQLNIFRPHNVGSHNMRSFEVPAIGGIMLAEDSPEHRLFFKNEYDIHLFRDANSAIDKINYLRSLDEEKAENIRNLARETSVEKKYSYRERAKKVAYCLTQELRIFK
jgi:spore maturation protein CgeB